MMTAAELLKSAGTTEAMVGGDEAAEWGGKGPDGKLVQKYGYGQLTLGASWADMDDEDAHYAASDQRAEDITEVVGTTTALATASPATVSADVMASMLTTECTHPAHGEHTLASGTRLAPLPGTSSCSTIFG